MRQVTFTAYYFNELPTEEAKENARKWYRDTVFYYDYDFVYEDAVRIGDALGITFNTTEIILTSGKQIWKPAIYWSGFWNQGDGACFEGTYEYKKNWQKDFPAPKDEELISIGKRLQEVQSKYFYKLTAYVKHKGHYYHEMCTEIDVDCEDREVDKDDADIVRKCLRDFMRWIYKSLKREFEFQISDEAVDETLIINEFEFDEKGNPV